MKHKPATERQPAPITPPLQPHRSAIARLINEATGVDNDADLAELEGIMRQDIWHSTLDWQTREQLVASAREARDVQLELRKQTKPEEIAVGTVKTNSPLAAHSKGPWLARKGDTFNPERTWGVVRVLSPDEHGCDPEEGERTEVIAEVYDTATDAGESDARRIAAAVNACEGITTEQLEKMGPGSFAQLKVHGRALLEALKGNLAQTRKTINLLDHHSSLSWIDFDGEEPGEPPHHVVIGGNAYWLEWTPQVAEYLVTAPVAADTGLVLFLENHEVEPDVPEYEAICAVLRATAPGEAS